MNFHRAFLALVPLAVGCTKDSMAPVPVPASLTLTPDTPTVHIDSVRQLSVTVRDQSGNIISNPTVSWLVFDTTTAQVDAHGLLSGRALGATSLAVASGSAFIQVPITTVTPVSGVSVGYRVACSLAPVGTAYCWGINVARPLPVPGGKHFHAVGSGNDDACGLDRAGSAYCWFSDSGSSGTYVPISTPVAVGGPAFDSLAVGYIYKCGLTAAGAAYCWMAAVDHNLNDSSFTTPAAFAGFTFTSISNTYAACGILAGGGAACWGPNYYGALGSHANNYGCGSKPCSSIPAPVDSTLPAPAIIAAGWYHSCAATAAGVAYCFGDNSSGALGDTVTGSGCWFRQLHMSTDSLYPCSEKPVLVRTNVRFTSLTAGGAHSCGLTSTGAAYCWGDNSEGQFGDGTVTSSAVPVPAAGGKRFRSLTASYESTCGIGLDGVAYCWGGNGWSLLGVGQPPGAVVTSPTRVRYQP